MTGKGLIDFTEIPDDGEVWELFARDFLQEIGFFIESSPDRGPDAGKDLLITEDLKGNLGNYKFRWLVSCKHFANSKNTSSVRENDEPNIRERLEAFNADGFIGFYSTIPAGGLNTRLRELKANDKIKDYRIFDSRLIENYLIRIGFSEILMRYFPKSYRAVKPLHALFGEYIPLECANCGQGLLKALYEKSYEGNLIYATKSENGKIYVKDLCWVCKSCDKSYNEFLKSRYNRRDGISTRWKDISDLANPVLFVRWILTLSNSLRDDKWVFDEEAYNKLQDFIMALSQKVLREMTEEERQRAIEVIDYESAFSF